MADNTNIIKYGWWGSENSPPEHLRTKKQLAEMGLKPLEPVAVIPTYKYDLYLYDPSNPDSATQKRKISEAQKEALKKAREKAHFNRCYDEWYKYVGGHIQDKNYAIQWARKFLSSDVNEWAILDTETTGLYSAEIVQIAIINKRKEVLMNSLVKPTISIPEDVINIHGITDNMVAFAPTFPEIYPQIKKALENKKVAMYGSDFDISTLKYCCQLHELPLLGLSKRSDCIKEWYAQFIGDWSDYYGSYRWYPLGGDHSALEDCLKALSVIKRMAKAKVIKDLKEEFTKNYYKKK